MLALLACTAVSAQTFAPAKTTPTTSRPSLQQTTPVAPAKVLLVDDDESDNNSNPASGKLSASDTFYRKLLDDRSIAYDTVVVPRYADGPPLDKLKGYSLVLWYTGASYGGNRDNTAVVSLRDEETLTRYLRETGGAVMLFSPGYLNNALGAGGAALWAEKKAPFLQQVLGIKGGRGLLQRFKEGSVVSISGDSFTVAKSPTVEIQFSAIKPESARTLFTAMLDPDGKGTRAVTVATSNAVGAGRSAYVGFSFENIANDAGKAFAQILQAVGVQAPAESNAAAPVSRCNADDEDIGGKCWPRCPAGTARARDSVRCESTAPVSRCNADEEDIGGKCLPRCPAGTARARDSVRCVAG